MPAVVITGSKHDAFAGDPLSVKLMKREVRYGQRILGICFGYQLLAHALGGKAGETAGCNTLPADDTFRLQCLPLRSKWHQSSSKKIVQPVILRIKITPAVALQANLGSPQYLNLHSQAEAPSDWSQAQGHSCACRLFPATFSRGLSEGWKLTVHEKHRDQVLELSPLYLLCQPR